MKALKRLLTRSVAGSAAGTSALAVIGCVAGIDPAASMLGAIGVKLLDQATGVGANLLAASMESAWSGDPVPGFNHDFRKALARALAASLAWNAQPPRGPLQARLLAETPLDPGYLQRLLDAWRSHVQAALDALPAPERLETLFPPARPDADYLDIACGEPGQALPRLWEAAYADTLPPELPGSLIVQMLGGEAAAKAAVLPLLAQVFPAQLAEILKQDEFRRGWIAFQKVLLERMLATVKATSPQTAKLLERLTATDTLLASFVDQQITAMAAVGGSLARLELGQANQGAMLAELLDLARSSQKPDLAGQAESECAGPAAIDDLSRFADLPAPGSPLTKEGADSLLALRPDPSPGVPAHIARRFAELMLSPLGGDPQADQSTFVKLSVMPQRRDAVDQVEHLFDTLAGMLAATSLYPGRDEPLWHLRGDPGVGKSTLLRHLELHTAHAALLAWAEDPQARPAVCVRVDLAGLRAEALDGSSDVAAVLEARWRRGLPGQPLPTWAELDHQASPRFLLDGLNEVACASPAALATLMRSLAQWGSGRIQRGLPAPVFTVRRLNFTNFPKGPELAQAVVADVQPWAPGDIERYLQLRFPGEEPSPLWAAIQQHPRCGDLLGLFANPFNLVLQCQLFNPGHPELAPNRGELMGRIALRRLADALAKGVPEFEGADLLTPADRSTVAEAADERPARALHQLSLEGGLRRQLEALAFDMHERANGAWGRWDPDTQPDNAVARAAWAAAKALHVAIQASDGTVRFSHQLWQEYLAACRLGLRGIDRWPDMAERPPAPDDFNAWVLPPPALHPWDQCARLAVQMAPEPERLLRHLVLTNPALAARGILDRGGDAGGASDQPLADLKKTLLERCEDPQLPVAARVEAGSLLGELGDDLRYEARTGPGGAAFRLPRAERWVPLPEGRWRIGGLADQENAREPVEVSIGAGISMAFAPVTNAEFACFIQAGGYGGATAGDEPPTWWQGELAGRWWSGEVPDIGPDLAWQNWRCIWRAADQGRPAVYRLFERRLTEQEFADMFDTPMALGDEAFVRWLGELYLGHLERRRLPLGWQDARHNNPVQPVVGVSWFEARAYCAWLSAQLRPHGLAARLPTEAEWEVAARWNGRELSSPHWPAETAQGPVAGVVNHVEGRLLRPSPVGAFPAGNARTGLADILGNVAEWTSSRYKDTGLSADVASEPAQVKNLHFFVTVRGGSWASPPATCRAADRRRSLPSDRTRNLGFRVVCCPIQEP